MPSRGLWKQMEQRRAAYDQVNSLPDPVLEEDQPLPEGDAAPDDAHSSLTDAMMKLPSKPQKPIFQPPAQPAQEARVVANPEEFQKWKGEGMPAPEGTTIDLDAIMNPKETGAPKQRGRPGEFGADPYYASSRIKQKYALANALLSRGLGKTENWGDVIAHPVMVYMAMKGLKEADAMSEDYSRQASEYYAKAAEAKRKIETDKLRWKALNGGYLSPEDYAKLGITEEEPPEGINGQ